MSALPARASVGTGAIKEATGIMKPAQLLALVLLLPALALAGAEPSLGDDKASAFKGSQKVAITEFGVEFYTQIHAEGRQGGADARVTTTLAGVSAEDFQAITEQAYADTVAQLKAAGFEVLDPAVVNADADHQALAEKYGAPSPYTFSDSSFGNDKPMISQIVAPAGMPAYFSSSLAVVRGGFGQRTDAQNQGRGMKEGELAKSLGATLLHIHYLVGFGLPSASKNNALWGGSTARATIEMGNVLFPQESEWQFVSSAGARTFTTSSRARHSGALYLSKPFTSGNNIYALQDSTSGADQRGDGVMNAMGGLLGGFGQKTKRSVATPGSAEAYRQDVQQLLSGATTAFASALAAAR